ncbi:XRE family transcriptional regulator [Streptococcus cristatus]|uniref:XRE family transcriptional regulator n=1 Tax=Streptococcus cristatus TaxID=45634 RepID=UPI0011F19E2B|nr:S24 family peptidase [Streptococcus cristatus]
MTNSLGNKKIMANNIRRHLDSLGLNVKDFATLMNFKYTTVLDWVNAKTYPRIDKIELMANYFKVDKSDLVERYTPSTSLLQQINDTVVQLKPPRQDKVLTYAEKQLNEQRNEEETKVNEVSEVIQLYSYDYYDHPASAGTGQYLNDVRVERIELPVDVDADFVIPIKGDSMEPDYHDGDLVFIQTSVDLNDGVIGVFNYNGDAYIKQLVIDKDQAYLHSLNPAYKDMPITPDTDFRIIGEVVDLYREK